MKRVLAIFILAATVCSGTFAEGFSVWINSLTDVFYTKMFTGSYSARDPDSIYRFQGDGDIKLFQRSAFDFPRNIGINYLYTGEKFGGFMELQGNMDFAKTGQLIQRLEWEVWASPISLVKVLAGSREQPGQIKNYQYFDDKLKNKIDHLGVLYPVYHWSARRFLGDNLDTVNDYPWGYDANNLVKGFVSFQSSSTSDLSVPSGAFDRSGMNWLLELNYDMFTVTASLGGLYNSISRPFLQPWEYQNRAVTRGNFYDAIYNPVLEDMMKFGLRVEAAQIADMVTLAAVFKYASTALAKLTAPNNQNIVDEKTGSQTFGLYANINPISDLGITVGYSGLIYNWSNTKDTDFSSGDVRDQEKHYLSQYKETMFPFYSGIDLRASYTGFDRFIITLNNNISFANAVGSPEPNPRGIYSYTWAYRGQLNRDDGDYLAKDRSESYLGLYNALGINFAINEKLAADFQVANQLGVFTLKWEHDDVVSRSNNLGLYAGVSYKIVESERIHATLCGGVAANLSSNSYQHAEAGGGRVDKAGVVEFGVPVGVRIWY